MNPREELIMKYEGYRNDGRAVFIVTLSTFVKSKSIAISDDARCMWDFHFIYRVSQQLPKLQRCKLDHDYIIERSPDTFPGAGVIREAKKDTANGFYHYHGFFAVPCEFGTRIFRDGEVHPQLRRALESFRNQGKYRPFCINAFEIEPVRSATAWAKYMTKTPDFISSTV